MSYSLLTIPNNDTDSNELSFGVEGYRVGVEMEIIAPATLPETVNLMVAGPANTFAIQRSGMQDIVLAAGRADYVTILFVNKIRLTSTGATGGARVFEVIWRIRGRSIAE